MKCLLLSFVCGRILPFPASAPTQWNFTPTGFNRIHWTKKSYFCKTPLQLEPYWISNNEMTCLLGIAKITQNSPTCQCVCVSVFVCVCVCVLHLAPTVTLYHQYARSENSKFTYNLIRFLQCIFISLPDLCINQTNCS